MCTVNKWNLCLTLKGVYNRAVITKHLKPSPCVYCYTRLLRVTCSIRAGICTKCLVSFRSLASSVHLPGSSSREGSPFAQKGITSHYVVFPADLWYRDGTATASGKDECNQLERNCSCTSQSKHTSKSCSGLSLCVWVSICNSYW